MIGNKKVLGIIPARGGSKGLPGKNLRPLLGKPLIVWSVEQGQASAAIDDLIVTTDDPAIADVAAAAGAEVPFLRPAELAADKSPTYPALSHAIDWLAARGRHYDYLVLLEPTSPLRESTDIDVAMALLDARNDAESIVAVSTVETQHPEFLVRTGEQGLLVPYLRDQVRVLRRQELEHLQYLCGTIYASKIDALQQRQTFYHERTLPYPIAKHKAHEIDDLCDFVIVEALLNARLRGDFS